MLIRFILMIIFGFSSAPSLSIRACIDLTETDLSANSCQGHTLWQKKVEWIRRIPLHGVAALSAFGIEEGNPFRDCIDLKGTLTTLFAKISL